MKRFTSAMLFLMFGAIGATAADNTRGDAN